MVTKLIQVKLTSRPSSPFKCIQVYFNIYEHLNQFKEYRGRRQAKDKYATYWISRYIVFSHHYDLIGLPKALKEVMKYKAVIE